MTHAKKILVTGGAGFIGSALARSLAQAGHDVTVCDLALSAQPNSIKKDATEYFAQLLETRSVVSTDQIDIFDVIFHLAAIPRLGIGVERPRQVIKNNVDSLLGALEYCRHTPQTQLIFASSSSVVWTPSADSPYTLSKLMGEQMIETYRTVYGVQATSARLYSVYGPGEADYGQWSTVIRQFKQCALKRVPLTVYGDGTARRDFTHVHDVVAGLIAIMNAQPPLPAVFELGTGAAPHDIKEIAQLFSRGVLKIQHAAARAWDCTATVADSSLFPAGWSATVSLREHILEWLDIHAAELSS